MRENYLAFVVRPAAGGTWELLVMNTLCGAAGGEFDVPRGRVPHGRDADEVVRLDAARYGIGLGERVAVLGDEPLLETRRRTVYVYRAAEGLPVSWTIPIETPARPKRSDGGEGPAYTVVGHFRFADLREPILIGSNEARWVGRVREVLGVGGPAGSTLVMWAPADAGIPESRAAEVADALTEGRGHSGAVEHDFGAFDAAFAEMGWDSHRLERRTVELGGRRVGYVCRVGPDGTQVEAQRSMVVHQAGVRGLWTFDVARRRLYRSNETPAPRSSAASGERVLLELKFDAELLAELARVGGPLMVWPLSPPVDEQGVREDCREAELAYGLWALAANQELIIGNKLQYFFDNDGIICPLVEDVGPLRELSERRVVRQGGGTVVHAFDRTPGWEAVVEHVGWAYLPNGPDTLWGDMHVGRRRDGVLAAVMEWCRAAGRTWGRRELRAGEVVHVVEGGRPSTGRAD